jgi:DNA-binding MarR family transcriptional regulator
VSHSRSDTAASHGIAADALFGLATTAVRNGRREMSLTALSTLSTLERTGPRCITDLAVTERVTQPSMTALVTRLEEAGFVRRHRDPLDRRVVLVALTEPGSAYLEDQRRAGAHTFAELIDELPPAEVAALLVAVPAMVHLRELERERRAPPWPGVDPGREMDHE